jgi:hypothetical protein
MGDRDPFGREHGEDPLAGMGWRAPTDAAPATAEAGPAAAVETPAPDPEPASPADPRAWVPAPAPAPRRRRFGGWRAASLVIRLAIIVAIGVAIASALVRVGGSINEAIEPVQPIEVDPEAAPPPVGLDRESYLRPENFRTALARLRGEGRVQSVRVAPDRITARLVSTKRRVVWNFRAGQQPQRVVGAPYYDFDTTIALSQIDANAPARLARAAAKRAHGSVNDVDYLYIQRNVGRARWVLYFKNRAHYTADRHGRHVERG